MKKIIIIMFLILSSSIFCNEIIKKNILFISSYNKDLPAFKSLEYGMNSVLNFTENENVVFFEFIDSQRLAHNDLNFLKKYLNNKYSNVHFDYIVCWDFVAINFISQNKDIFKEVPKILLKANKDYLIKNNLYSEKNFVLNTVYNFSNLLKEITTIMDVKKIKVIAETNNELTKNNINLFKQAIAHSKLNFEVEYLLNMNIEDIKKNLSTYEKNTIAFYLLMFSDGHGNSLMPYQVSEIISKDSKIPIFSYWEDLVNKGVVGGYSLSFKLVGKELGEFLLSENNEHFKLLKGMRSVYDYNALKKWNISLKNLPKNSIILNKKENLFVSYKIEVTFIFIFFITIICFLYYRHFFLKKNNLNLQILNLELEEKNKRLEELSTTDTLTKLNNRRVISKKVDEELKRNKRYGTPFSILILDIDHFKKINDSFGHNIGDIVLKKIGKIIIQNIRTVDIAARWGGEEFLILGINTKLENAEAFAEILRAKFENTEFEKVEKITVSIGVAEYHPGESFKKLYSRADEALYEAKSKGRNKVIAKKYNPNLNKDIRTFKLKWMDQYLSGNEIVDKQHMELFDLTNKLIDFVLFRFNEENIENLLFEIKEKSEKHFENEEKLLLEANFKELDKHKILHKELLIELKKQINNYKIGKINEVEFLLFISHKLIAGHIKEEDSEFFKIFEKNSF